MSELNIRRFVASDRADVVALWSRELPNPHHWNDPSMVVDRKLACQADLFFVGELRGQIVATVMAGYDGVRGWLYRLTVAAPFRRRGFGRQMTEFALEELQQRGCPKVNLQVRDTNANAVEFYRRLGFQTDATIGMGLSFPKAVERTPACDG